jgi:hypothetical protein
MQFEATQPPAQSPDVITPKELIKKHIADPTHKVTDEELKRLVVGVFPSQHLPASAGMGNSQMGRS